ncbi:hypothetical protein [Deinococcus sp. UYEF24]
MTMQTDINFFVKDIRRLQGKFYDAVNVDATIVARGGVSNTQAEILGELQQMVLPLAEHFLKLYSDNLVLSTRINLLENL